MKPSLLNNIAALLLALVVMLPVSVNAQEYDDLYFSSKDRKSKKEKKSKKKEKQAQVDYIQEYQESNGNGMTYYSDDYPSDNYYEQDTIYIEDDSYGQPTVINNYYGNTVPVVDPNPWSFGLGWSPFGWSMGFSYGFGSPYYGWYDPFYFPPYYSFCSYRWNYPYYGSYASGYHNGYFDGYYGNPYNPYGEYYYSSRNVRRGGRSSRGSVLAHNEGSLGRISSVRPERALSSRTRPRQQAERGDIEVAQNAKQISDRRSGRNSSSNRQRERVNNGRQPNTAITSQGMAATRTIQNEQNRYAQETVNQSNGRSRPSRKRTVVVQTKSGNPNAKNLNNRTNSPRRSTSYKRNKTSNNYGGNTSSYSRNSSSKRSGSYSSGSSYRKSSSSSGSSRSSYSPSRSSRSSSSPSRSSGGSSRGGSRSSSGRSKR